MLTQNKIKLIRSLELKKNRIQSNSFIIEGEKMVLELLQSKFKTIELFASSEFLEINKIAHSTHFPITEISDNELKKISFLKTPNKVLALVEIPKPKTNTDSFKGLAIALDNIQDPGNLGTIIRTANWFGVKNIFCSPDTVDAFNSKVIQSTMGAIFRTAIFYCDLSDLIKTAKNKGLPVYGTLLKGNNIYDSKLNKNALIVLGNESKGISKPIQKLIDHQICIPDYSKETGTMESLNVGIANAIVLAEFKRQFAY